MTWMTWFSFLGDLESQPKPSPCDLASQGGRPWSPPPGPLALPRTLRWCGPGAATRGGAGGVAGGAVFGWGAWGTRLGSSWLSCWIYGDFLSQLCGNLNIKAVIWGIPMEKNSYICCVFFLGGMIPHSIHGIFVYLRVDFNENPTIDLFFFGGWPVDLPFHGAPKSSKNRIRQLSMERSIFPLEVPLHQFVWGVPSPKPTAKAPENGCSWKTIVSFWGNFGLFSGAMNVSFRERILDLPPTRARRMRVYSSPHRDVYITYWDLESRLLNRYVPRLDTGGRSKTLRSGCGEAKWNCENGTCQFLDSFWLITCFLVPRKGGKNKFTDSYRSRLHHRKETRDGHLDFMKPFSGSVSQDP